MSVSRLRVASLGLLATCLVAAPLRAQTAQKPVTTTEPPHLTDSAELARVVSFYEAGKYGECADALRRLLTTDSARPLHDADVIESARIYHAACLIGSGQNQAADEPLRAAIRQNPQMKAPDSLVFPAPVVERFLRVRETMFDVIRKAEDERVRRAQELAAEQEERARKERARVVGLEELAQQQSIVVPNSRWFALVPFGVGQFQNGDKPLGFVFLTSEVLLAAATLTSIGVQTHLVLEANRVNKVDPSINGRLDDWHTAIEITSYAWLGVTVIGIVEAQLSFVPEQHKTRRRPLPAELRPQSSAVRWVPSAVPVPGGALLGVSGRF